MAACSGSGDREGRRASFGVVLSSRVPPGTNSTDAHGPVAMAQMDHSQRARHDRRRR